MRNPLLSRLYLKSMSKATLLPDLEKHLSANLGSSGYYDLKILYKTHVPICPYQIITSVFWPNFGGELVNRKKGQQVSFFKKDYGTEWWVL